ncbi:MAG: LysR family transcriptional regulator [Pseudomonadota bacterium]|nr:LysR family transcriptional regulator [Pseudomonadota bacterium]
MSLDQLQAVVTIAEEGTLVRAARRLRISQPPLTRKVRALEAELGVTLFDRGARGMRPTAAGEALLTSARGILAAVAEVTLRVREVPGQPANPAAGGPRTIATS